VAAVKPLKFADAAVQQFAAGDVVDPTFIARGRNLIIGGDFTTNPWQRGTSFTAIGYTADRWYWNNSSAAAFSILKTADAPTAAEAGVYTQDCLHIDCTTADASVAAGDFALLAQFVEGKDCVSLGFGQSGTRYVTLSFWVKATKTGTYCASIRNSANSRSYVKEYSVSTTNTWEYKSLVFPVDTSGTWLYDTGVGLRIVWAVMCGSTYQTTADTWAAGVYAATSNQVNGFDSTSNDFKLALVQLEAGAVASSFQPRSVSDEWWLCRRYYRQWNFPAGGFPIATGYCTSTTAWFASGLCAENTSNMRATPTIGMGSASNYLVYDSAGSAVAVTSFNVAGNSGDGGMIYASGYVSSGLTAGAATTLGSSVANAATVTATAEL